MPRIRTIKPEFWSSPGNRGLDYDARLLFIAMWNWADDSGRGSANPRELAGFAFPHDEDVGTAEIRRMLGGIRRAYGVVFYIVAHRAYYYVPTWCSHQKIDKRSNSKHPPPEDGETFDPTRPQPSDQEEQGSTGSVESSPRARRKPGAGSRNRGTGEEGPQKSPVSAPVRSHKRTPRSHTSKRSAEPVPHPDAFDRFWSHYPRKQAKQRARAAWARAVDRADPETIVAGAERQAAEAARATDQRFTPLPSTWLREDRWHDTPLPPPIATTDLRIAQAQALKTDDAAPTGAELNGRQDP